MTGPWFSDPTPIAIAHRGGRLLWPENTMVAFQGAVDLGYRHIETDLHATRDGVLVTLHDHTLERTTDGTGPVAQREWAELATVDAGYRFAPHEGYPWRGKGVGLARLEEVMATFSELRLILEIKQSGIAGLVADFLDHHGWEERVIVGSFSDRRLRRFRRLSGGRVATSAGTRETATLAALARAGLALRGPADALQVPPDTVLFPLVDERLVAAAHAAGKPVHVWTVNDPGEMERLLDLGVDGVITDRPDVLRALLERRGQFRPQG